jgi:hypothetical protein
MSGWCGYATSETCNHRTPYSLPVSTIRGASSARGRCSRGASSAGAVSQASHFIRHGQGRRWIGATTPLGSVVRKALRVWRPGMGSFFVLERRANCVTARTPLAGGAKQALSTDTQAPHPCPRGSFSISHRLSGASSPGDSSVAGRADRVALDVNARTGGPVIVPVADAHGERRVTQA